jgi:hypothetical protein
MITFTAVVMDRSTANHVQTNELKKSETCPLASIFDTDPSWHGANANPQWGFSHVRKRLFG